MRQIGGFFPPKSHYFGGESGYVFYKLGGPAGGVHGDSPSNSIIIPPGAQTTPGYNLGGYPKMDGYATLSYYMGILILIIID